MKKPDYITWLAISLVLGTFVFFLVILFLSEGFYGGGDNLTHYRFSRYVYIHPEFLLHHWAKPVFTLISFPFAQFGFKGVQIMNILFGTASAYFGYKIARKLGYHYSPLVILFLCFTPIYSIIMFSGMTEIMFGFFSILAAYLYINSNFKSSATLISYTPLIRVEGIFLISIFGLGFLLKKKYKAIFLLFTGFLIYSFIGFFYYKDFFWLITKMPYRGATDLYGTGPLSYYFASAKTYLGLPMEILLVLGIIGMIYSFVREPKKVLPEVLIILLPFIIYFTAHILMWYTGIGNSDGETRYMAAIIPFTAIINLRGLNFLFETFKKFRYVSIVKLLIIPVVIFLFVKMPFKSYHLPVKLYGTQKVVKAASDWMISNGYNKRKLYYYDPDFIYFLNFNPFDETRAHEFVHDVKQPEYKVELGDLVLWEAHFTPNCKLPFETMMNSPYYKLTRVFKPETNFKMFGRNYQVCIFERADTNPERNNYDLYNQVIQIVK